MSSTSSSSTQQSSVVNPQPPIVQNITVSIVLYPGFVACVAIDQQGRPIIEYRRQEVASASSNSTQNEEEIIATTATQSETTEQASTQTTVSSTAASSDETDFGEQRNPTLFKKLRKYIESLKLKYDSQKEEYLKMVEINKQQLGKNLFFQSKNKLNQLQKNWIDVYLVFKQFYLDEVLDFNLTFDLTKFIKTVMYPDDETVATVPDFVELYDQVYEKFSGFLNQKKKVNETTSVVPLSTIAAFVEAQVEQRKPGAWRDAAKKALLSTETSQSPTVGAGSG
jgi:hypothetical protein